tara:strand:- start:529 stop:633 length:105 start_codon:yes stop_codon:yes gene_type:complete
MAFASAYASGDFGVRFSAGSAKRESEWAVVADMR